MLKKLIISSFVVLLLGLLKTSPIDAASDCPGRLTPPTSGIFTRYCTDGDNDGDDQGRLIKPWLYPASRVYPGDTLRIHAKVLDYNETCSDKGCLKNDMPTRSMIEIGGYHVDHTKLRITLFDSSGQQIQTWDKSTTSNSTTGGGTYPVVDSNIYSFSGANYGTWWIRYEDIETDNSRVNIGDYTWQPISYQPDLNNDLINFYGYQVPAWFSDFYEGNIAYLQNLQIQDGPSKGLFHNSISEPRLTALGGSLGPIKQYHAWEDTMQTGFVIKSLYELWLITSDPRIEAMIEFTIDNTYTKFQGDFSPVTIEGNLNPGTEGNWIQGNFNSKCAVYAYAKAFNQPPYQNQEVWLRGKTTWLPTGWAIKSDGNNDCGGDQFAGQAIGVYYSIKYLEQKDPTNPNIDFLKNTIKSGNTLTGGVNGWMWISSFLGGRAQGIFYSIMQQIDPSIGDFIGGNNKHFEQWTKNLGGAGGGYGSALLDRIHQPGNTEVGTIKVEDDVHAIFYNAITSQIYDKTTSDFGGDMTISDYRNALIQSETNVDRFFTAFGHQTEEIPYGQMHWRGQQNDLFLNTTTTDAVINHGYSLLRPFSEAYYPNEIINNANTVNSAYNFLKNIARRSEFDENYNYLPTNRVTKDAIGLAVYYDSPGGYLNYTIRNVASAFQEMSLYLNLHQTNTSRIDLDNANLNIDLLNKQWDKNNTLSFRPWEDGTVKISNENQRSGYIYRVQKETGGINAVIVTPSGETNLEVITNEKYSIDNPYNLSILPLLGNTSVLITNWNGENKTWTETNSLTNNTTSHTISGLDPLESYSLKVNGENHSTLLTDVSGTTNFEFDNLLALLNTFEITKVPATPTPTPTPTTTPTPTPTETPVPTETPTPTPTADTTPPTINIINPQNGAVLARNSQILITAEASDDVLVTRVDFFVNNNLICQHFSPDYSSCGWKIPGKPNATYAIKTVAIDSSNNSAQQEISVTSSQ